MPVTSSRTLASTAGAHADTFKSSDSLPLGKHHTPPSPTAAGRLQHPASLTSPSSTNISTSKWATWSSGSSSAAAAAQCAGALKAASSSSGRQLGSSSSLFKPKLTTSHFDSIASSSSGSPGTGAAGRSASVPRSRGVFDAARGSQAPPASSTHSRLTSYASTGLTASTSRSSSTGRSLGAGYPGGAAATPARTLDTSSPAATVPGRARVMLGRVLHQSSTTDSSLRPSPPGGLAGGSSSSSSSSSRSGIGQRSAAAAGVHRVPVCSTIGDALPAAVPSKVTPAGASQSMQRPSSPSTVGLATAGGRVQQHQQHQQQHQHQHQQEPPDVEGLSAVGSSHRLHAAATTTARPRLSGVSSVRGSAPPLAAVGNTATSGSGQLPSGSSYLARLHRQRAATADAASTSSSYASGSSMAAAGRRVASASTTSSSRQQALDALRAGRMRMRAPDPDVSAAPLASAAVSTQAKAWGAQSSGPGSRPRAGTVADNSSAGQHSTLQGELSPPAADSMGSAVASLTALLQRLNSKKQEAAAADSQPWQESPAGQQQPDQLPSHPQQRQEPSGVGPVAGRRAADSSPGPGERLEFPALQQQQQPAAVLRSKSGSQPEVWPGSYIDMIRSSKSSSRQPHQQQQELPLQQRQQPAEQLLQRQQQQSHPRPCQQHAYQPDQCQPPLWQRQQAAPDIGHMTAALQRHGAAAAAAGGTMPVYRPPGSLASSSRTSSLGSEGGAQVYRPPYVPPQAASAHDQGGSSSIVQPHVAQPAPAVLVPGAAHYRHSSSSWRSSSPEPDDTHQPYSSAGSAEQLARGWQQQRVQQQPTVEGSSQPHGQHAAFLISTQPMAERSSNTGQQQPYSTVSSSHAAAWASDQAAAHAAAADAAARHAFLNSSPASSSVCSDDADEAAAGGAMRAAGQLPTSTTSSSRQQQPQQQAGLQGAHARGADGTMPAAAAGPGAAAAGAQQLLGSRRDTSRRGMQVAAAAARSDIGAVSDSDSDVSEMSCSSLDSSSSSSSVAVTVSVRAPSHAASHQQGPAYPDHPQQGRSRASVQLAAYDSDVSPDRGSRTVSGGSRAGALAQPPSAAAVGAAVPAKAYARSLVHRGPGLPRGCCGLRNQGNTCYQNSALQLLGCVPELVGALLGEQAVQLFQAAAADAANSRSKGGSMHRALVAAAAAAQAGIEWLPKASVGPALQALVCEMWGFPLPQQQQQHHRSSPGQHLLLRQQAHPQGVSQCMGALRSAMADLDPRWDDGDQWDCQEFCVALLHAVHNDSNRVRGRPTYRELKLQGCEAQQAAEAAAYARSWEDSVVLDIFSWQLQSTMACTSCGKRSHAFDSAQELLVAIPAGSEDVTLQECLSRTTFSSEKMVGEEGYKCESCKALREATKQLQVFTYPRVLLLGLKRFETRGGSRGGSKACEMYSSRKVSTRVRLDARERLDLSPFCNPAGLKAAAAAGMPPPLYELLAVADHTGCINGGHYTARGRCLLDGAWTEFNDSLVLPANPPSGSSREAYFLLYRLVG